MFDWIRNRMPTTNGARPDAVPPIETLEKHNPKNVARPFNEKERDRMLSVVFQKAHDLSNYTKSAKQEMWTLVLFHLAESYSHDPSIFNQSNINKNIYLLSKDGLRKLHIKLKKGRSIDSATMDGVKPDIMACLEEWSKGAQNKDAMETIIRNAFETDAAGNVNRWRVWMLFQIESEDPRWVRAMSKLKQSFIVTDVERYMIFYQRKSLKEKWEKIILNFSAL